MMMLFTTRTPPNIVQIGYTRSSALINMTGFVETDPVFEEVQHFHDIALSVLMPECSLDVPMVACRYPCRPNRTGSRYSCNNYSRIDGHVSS